VVTTLAALRKEVEELLPSVHLATRSHADREFFGFMQLAIGNVAAIETLAKADKRLVMAGTAAARAAYEVMVTATWLVATDDLLERERRWAALLADERKFWRRVFDDASRQRQESDDSAEWQELDESVKSATAEVQRVEAIITAVQPQLDAARAGQVKPVPNVEEMLEQIGKPGHYVIYKTACQLVHPANRALALVRDFRETHREDLPVATYSYRTTERDWWIAIMLGAESLVMGLETLAAWLKGPPLSQRAAGLFNDILAKARTL